jgi:hypothetical protein
MMEDLFLGLECFREDASLSEKLLAAYEEVTRIVSNGTTDGDYLRKRMIALEAALVPMIIHACQHEKRALAMEPMRPRCPPWMRHLWRRGV